MMGSLTAIEPFLGDYSYYAIAAGAYLVGSIPFGLVLTKLAGLGDVRNIGSGNIGATNVLRTGNKFLALATLLLDGGKGALAVFIAMLLEPSYGGGYAIIAAPCAFLGHIFPVWLKFKGGKGVATFLGTLLALSWPLGLATALTWFAATLLFRMSSLSALIASLAAPVWALLVPSLNISTFKDLGLATVIMAMAAMIFWSHRENIKRILKGTEPKIGQK